MTKGLMEKYGICTSPKAELKALKSGLLIAKELNIKQLIILMDSQLVFQWLNKEIIDTHPHYYLVADCKNLINLPGWIVKVTHCYREANPAADLLANRGIDLIVPRVFINSPPHDLLSILHEDLAGVAWPRMVKNLNM